MPGPDAPQTSNNLDHQQESRPRHPILPSGTPAMRHQVAGLERPVQISVDHWGIPHIRAESDADLFFAQGFNAARDRLWQIDLWRKRGLGLLAADFGPGYLEQDVAARAFLFRGDMEQEWIAYASDTRAICTSFVAGINAFIALAETTPDLLPPEFGLMGTRPGRWQPEDVLRVRSHALTRNGLSEVIRACLLEQIGTEADLLRKNLEPHVTPVNAGEVDLSRITPAILDLFKLATAPVSFAADRLAAKPEDAPHWRNVNALAEVVQEADWTGSNNWVIDAAHTRSGRPIMATDPHRNHAMPSLRYVVHLTGPGFDAIGAGEPSMPGISLGHNGFASFSQTIFGADQEDIYVYDLSPDDPDAYRYGDGWEKMTRITERFEVKGAPDQMRDIVFTRHGPLLWRDPEAPLAYAMRSVWFEPGAAAYLAGLSSMRARSLDDFRDAISRFGTPSLNHLYADSDGTIAWLPFGLIPRRDNWDGLLPVPGDGRFEWNGFVERVEMPETVNPADGWLATANEANMPADWDHTRTMIGYEWLEASRARRITRVMEATALHDLQTSAALQTDTYSLPAERLLGLLAGVSGASLPDAVRAVFDGWDHRLEPGSAAAALFEVWFTRFLKPAMFSLVAPADRHSLMEPGDIEGLISALETPTTTLFGDEPVAARDGLMARTLIAAHAHLCAELGSDSDTWHWGDLHHGYFEHPLTRLGAAGDLTLDVGPLAKGGSASTVMHAAYRGSDYRITMGASVRMLIDVGGWDNSLFINAPGQSGDPGSPHFGDLAPLWARGEYLPMLYSREAVDAATEMVIHLDPAPSRP